MKIRYSFILLCSLVAGAANAQSIPNNSFEEWDGNGNPVGWATTNQQGVAMPITKSTMHVSGQFSARGEVIDFSGFPFPPILMSGSSTETPGFPIHARPEALNVYMAGQFAEGEGALVTVLLGTTENPIGGGAYTLNTNTPELTAVSIPITYNMPGNADSAIITVQIMAQQAHLGSYYIVDDFTFGSASSSVKYQGEPTEFTVTKSVRYDEIAFEAYGATYTMLEILDIHGRTVETLYAGVTDQLRMRWEGRGLANGMYFARLTRPEGTQMRKVILNR